MHVSLQNINLQKIFDCLCISVHIHFIWMVNKLDMHKIISKRRKIIFIARVSSTDDKSQQVVYIFLRQAYAQYCRGFRVRKKGSLSCHTCLGFCGLSHLKGLSDLVVIRTYSNLGPLFFACRTRRLYTRMSLVRDCKNPRPRVTGGVAR